MSADPARIEDLVWICGGSCRESSAADTALSKRAPRLLDENETARPPPGALCLPALRPPHYRLNLLLVEAAQFNQLLVRDRAAAAFNLGDGVPGPSHLVGHGRLS
jgi:hypothetical protein